MQSSLLLSRYRWNWFNQWQLFPYLIQTFSSGAVALDVLTFPLSKWVNGHSVIKYNWQYLGFYILLVHVYKSRNPIRSRHFWVAISEIYSHLFYWIFFFKFPFFISETCPYLMKGITAKRIAYTCLLTNTCKSNFYEYMASLKEICWWIDSKKYDTNLDTIPVTRDFCHNGFKNWLAWLD